MKNDQEEVNPQPQSSNIENPSAATQPLANNNGRKTNEPERGYRGSQRKTNWLRQKNRSEPAERQTVDRTKNSDGYQGMPSSTGSIPNGCWSSTRMVRKARANYDFYADVFKHSAGELA